MFSVEEITNVVQSPAFHEDERTVQEALSRYRLGQEQLFLHTASTRLRQFVECVLSSAPYWDQQNASRRLCRLAAEIAEVLASHDGYSGRMKLKSALLYELAGLPAISKSVAATDNLPNTIKPFLLRGGAFGSLSPQLNGMDIVPWLATRGIETVRAIVRGPDNRRIDFDLEERLTAIRRGTAPATPRSPQG